MNKAVPWNVNGVGFDAREAAREAARRQGKSLGEWLHGVIADHAADLGVEEHEIANQQRIEAVTSKLERLSARSADHDRRMGAGRGNDFARRAPFRDRDEEVDEREMLREGKTFRPSVVTELRRRRESPANESTELLLEEAIDVMERRASRAERHTDNALQSFSKLLERNEAHRDRERESVTALAQKLSDIETRLADRLGQTDENPIKGALARLEARLDTIGRRGAAEAAARLQADPAQPPAEPFQRLEEKLNSIFAAVQARPQPTTETSSFALAASQAGHGLEGPEGRADRKDRHLSAVADIAKRQRTLQGADADPLSLQDALHRRRVSPPPHRDDRSADAAPFASMKNEIATLASKIEDLRRHVVVERPSQAARFPDLDALHAEIAAMSGALRELAPRSSLSGIETSIRTLTERFEASREPVLAETSPPAEIAAATRRRLPTDITPRGIIRGFDNDRRDPGADASAIAQIQDQMREIRDLIATHTAKIDQAVAAPRQYPATPREGTTAPQDANDRALLIPPHDENVLETLVRDLSQKMDAVQAPGAGDHALEALQKQVALLSSRFERSDDGLAKLTSLERSMRDLFTHLDETRASVETSAARTAREVLRIAMEEGRVQSDQGTATSLATMQALQDEAEARTSSTLNAVHGTLEKVVDRLSVMESDFAASRKRSLPRSPVMGSLDERAAEPQFPELRAPELKAPGPRSTPARPPSNDIPLGVPDPAFNQSLGHRPSEKTAKASAAGARGASLTHDDESGRADFIAAARRAAKMAQNDPALADMKRHAGDKTGSVVRAGLLEQSRDYVTRHKRPVLLSIAALFVILGTMAVIQRAGLDVADTQTADVVAPVQIAQTVAPAPTPRKVRQTDELSPSALPTSAPAIANPIPGSDPIQTGSIPSLPSFAAANGAGEQHPALPSNLKAMAEGGDSAAEYVLGAQYAGGTVVPRDYSRAAQWYQKAAAQNLAPAQYRLASLYEKGLGVPQDKAKAKGLYLLAAEAGNPRAMHNLAVLLADGDGKPDYDGAATWFRKAAQYGIHDSQYNLAILLARGIGVQQSLVQSYQWFAIAAAQGDTDAAKKRDEVGGKLGANDLVVAKALATAFHPRIADVAATEVRPPSGA